MIRNQLQANKFDRLRSQAQELLMRRGDEATQPSMGMLELIHELQIYQAELEIQNEELQQARRGSLRCIASTPNCMSLHLLPILP